MAITFTQTFAQGVFEVHNCKPTYLVKRVHQTHSDIVLTIDEFNQHLESIGSGDGLIDLEKKYHLAVLTADCIPVIFLGELGNAIVHAGWMGVKNQISLNQKIQNLKVNSIFIGPHIRVQNFEVQKDFKQHFSDKKYYHEINGKLFFDLTAKLIDDLTQTYKNANIIDCGLDTRSDPRFHSYRRNKTVLRNWNVFKII